MTDLALTRRRLLQIGAVAPLAACSIGGSTPPRTFSLRPQPPIDTSGPGWALGIDVPKALKGLDSERIAYRTSEFELQYYADADWIDLAPEMVQMVLVRSFQNRTRLVVRRRISCSARCCRISRPMAARGRKSPWSPACRRPTAGVSSAPRPLRPQPVRPTIASIRWSPPSTRRPGGSPPI
jgi:hypothetical protein